MTNSAIIQLGVYMGVACFALTACQPAEAPTESPPPQETTPYGSSAAAGKYRNSTTRRRAQRSGRSRHGKPQRQETSFHGDAPTCVSLGVSNIPANGYIHVVNIRNSCRDYIYCEVGTNLDPDAFVPARIRPNTEGAVRIRTNAKKTVSRAAGFCEIDAPE